MGAREVMEEVALEELDPRFQTNAANARKAIGKNPAYAMDILQSILVRQPGCLRRGAS